MMKWICLLLLVVNIGYFGWVLDQRTREEVRMRSSALQVADDVPRLKMISELQRPPVRRETVRVTQPRQRPDSADATDETDVEESAATDSPELVTILPDISASPAESMFAPSLLEANACFSFGPFTHRHRAKVLHDWLLARQSRARLRREDNSHKPLLWVYLEPRAGAEAGATLQELRDRGIQDVSLIDRGDLKNAISLGLFATQASVNRRLQELEDQGYRPVVVPYNEGRLVYWVDAEINRRKLVDELAETYPANLNFLPIECSKIVLARPDQ